jgi:hypothetical protein
VKDDSKKRYAAIVLFALAGLLLVWIARMNTRLPEMPTTHYNTGALLKKDGSGCVDASEKPVPCPAGTPIQPAAPAGQKPATGGFKIK